MSHPICFVSLGPGDAGQVTLNAYRVLQQADCIYCPSTVTPTGASISRAACLLRQLELEDRIRLFALPMGKDRTQAMTVYRKIAHDIQREYNTGKRVAVAVEGDVGIYASIHYVQDCLEKGGAEVNQLPGIPSFIAAGALARLSLASQAERLVILPGEVTAEELDTYLLHRHVIVVLKLSRCADAVKKYMACHPECSYHYFENVSTPQEYHSNHRDELQTRPFPYFSLMVILDERNRTGLPE